MTFACCIPEISNSWSSFNMLELNVNRYPKQKTQYHWSSPDQVDTDQIVQALYGKHMKIHLDDEQGSLTLKPSVSTEDDGTLTKITLHDQDQNSVAYVKSWETEHPREMQHFKKTLLHQQRGI